jgi:hypothetical protein
VSAVFVRLLQAPAAKAVRQAVLIRARRAERAISVRMGTSSWRSYPRGRFEEEV